jgi:insertion element IS1 protein InsB
VAYSSGLIVSARVGKHTDALLNELLVSNQGKTDCTVWKTDEWGGYNRILPEEVEHWLGKAGTQRIERTNGIVRQQTGRWHRRQNKFGKVWEQTKVTTRLVVSYFNWLWQDTGVKTTAAQRAGLAIHQWSWDELVSYPTLV